MTFADFTLDSTITDAIRSAGYTSPTPIQQKAMPVVIEGRDVLGIAQTGTGKTAAFVLPILQRLNKKSSRKPRHGFRHWGIRRGNNLPDSMVSRPFHTDVCCRRQKRPKGQSNGNQETIIP